MNKTLLYFFIALLSIIVGFYLHDAMAAILTGCGLLWLRDGLK